MLLSQTGAEVEKLAERRGIGSFAPEFDRVPAGLSTKFGANVVVHRREPRRVRSALERFEVEFREVDAVPVEALDHLFEAGADGFDAVAILQVHELAPVELRVLQDGGLLAPGRMVVPELLADVRQFDPGIDENAVAMAGLDEALSGTRPARDRSRRSATRRHAAPRFRPSASARRGSRDRRAFGTNSRRRPRGGSCERRARSRGPRAPASGRESARSRSAPGSAATHSTAPCPMREPATSGADVQRSFANTRALSGTSVARKFDRALPDDRQRGVVDIDQVHHGDRIRARLDSRSSRRAAKRLPG